MKMVAQSPYLIIICLDSIKIKFLPQLFPQVKFTLEKLSGGKPNQQSLIQNVSNWMKVEKAYQIQLLVNFV